MGALVSDNKNTYATGLGTLAGTLKSALQQAQDLQQSQTDNDYVSKLNASATYALNADGSAGTADGSPNTANPIAGLNISAVNYSAFIAYGLNDLITFLTGTGSVATADRRTIFGKLLP